MLNVKTIAFCFALVMQCCGSGEYRTNNPYVPTILKYVKQCDMKNKIIIRTRTVHPLILQAYRQLRNQK